MKVNLVTDFEVRSFSTDVIDASFNQPVLVDFWAKWCAPCQYIGPIVEKLAAEAVGKWKLVKVNTEKNKDIAQDWGIQGIPNLKLFYKGEVIDEVSGAMGESDMRNWLLEKLPSKATTLSMEGSKMIEKGLIKEGITLLEGALAEDDSLAQARILLANQKIWKAPQEAIDLVNPITYLESANEIHLIANSLIMDKADLPEGRSKENVWQSIKMLRKQQYNEAIEQLIAAIIMEKSYMDEFSRRLVIALFHYLGESNSITQNYRRQFDMALY